MLKHFFQPENVYQLTVSEYKEIKLGSFGILVFLIPWIYRICKFFVPTLYNKGGIVWGGHIFFYQIPLALSRDIRRTKSQSGHFFRWV